MWVCNQVSNLSKKLKYFAWSFSSNAWGMNGGLACSSTGNLSTGASKMGEDHDMSETYCFHLIQRPVLSIWRRRACTLRYRWNSIPKIFLTQFQSKEEPWCVQFMLKPFNPSLDTASMSWKVRYDRPRNDTINREKNLSNDPCVCPTSGYWNSIADRVVDRREMRMKIAHVITVEFFVSFTVLSAPT